MGLVARLTEGERETRAGVALLARRERSGEFYGSDLTSAEIGKILIRQQELLRDLRGFTRTSYVGLRQSDVVILHDGKRYVKGRISSIAGEGEARRYRLAVGNSTRTFRAEQLEEMPIYRAPRRQY